MSTSPDTPIAVKVSYNGNTRRFKIPLMEVGPSIFQDKLRELLAIPDSEEIMFERFSDSAGRYVTLDPQDVAVYKQLYRAAKAKLKLRIKATTIGAEGVPLTTETASNMYPPSYSSTNVSTNVNLIPPHTTAHSVTSVPVGVDSAQLDSAVAKAVDAYCTSSEFTTQLRDTVREEVVKQQPEPVKPAQQTGKIFPSIISPPTPPHHTIFAIYCNDCKATITGAHFHCEICDNGDYDLCNDCVKKGRSCYNIDHCMIKRDVITGKPCVEKEAEAATSTTRICNTCVRQFADDQFVSCVECKDYDLCLNCLRAGGHGHDPRHSFARTHPAMQLTEQEERLLPAGRGFRHQALCDGCDKTIYGVRHKCIDCPDWDYCSECVKSAPIIHSNHRLVPVFEDSTTIPTRWNVPLSAVVHSGVYCDGPICSQYRHTVCIRGARYKCAICPDTDFCATCEASPSNMHNSSHPLIKFKTPIRNVLVTTTDNTNTVMGDVPEPAPEPVKTEPTVTTTSAATQVHSTENVVPPAELASSVNTESVKAEEVEKVEESQELPKQESLTASVALDAKFVKDLVADGTAFVVGQDFTQVWTMQNVGTVSWPAGVTIKFAGGDYMFLKSDEESLKATITESEVHPGEIVDFFVNLQATWPANKKYVSYWRLCAPDGQRFGDNLWCSISVQECPIKEVADLVNTSVQEEDRHSEADSVESVVDANSVKSMSVRSVTVTDDLEDFESATGNLALSQASSQMVFPKLPVESPMHSVEHLPESSPAEELVAPSSSESDASHKTFVLSEHSDAEEIDISSVDSEEFMTDEEYDVLCASDEEFEEVA